MGLWMQLRLDERVHPLGFRGRAHLLSSKVHVQETHESRQLAISLVWAGQVFAGVVCGAGPVRRGHALLLRC